MEMMESPIADGGILNSIISAKNGIPDGSKEAEHPFESEQGIVEVVVDESSSLQGSKADAFVPFDIKDTEDNEKQEVSSRAEIRTLQAVDFVNCVNDTDATNTSKSCAEACSDQGLNCCIRGGQVAACGGFTGKVYNNSCNGQNLPNRRARAGSCARPAMLPLPGRISSARRALSCGCRQQCRATIRARRCDIRGRRWPPRLNAGPMARTNAEPCGPPPPPPLHNRAMPPCGTSP